MLFSPPSEFGRTSIYRVIGITSAVHAGLLCTFFLVQVWFGSQPLVFSLKNAGRVSMRSSRSKKSETLAKKVPMKKTTVPQKKIVPAKKTVKKKLDQKKKAPPKPKPVKKDVPLAKKQEVKKVSEKTSPVPEKKVTKQQSTEPVAEKLEVEVAQVMLSADAVIVEFARHFSLPPGFEDIEPFEVRFDVKEGKVTNISPHRNESLVVYTAVKDALLKSSMPSGKTRRVTMKIM